MNINASKSNIMPRFNYRDLMIFIVPVLIFLLYLFVYNPGVLTVASYSQLHQIATGKFTSSSPIFHTLLEMICLKIFGGPFFIGLFQILVFAAIWMAICKYHRDDNAKGSNQFVVQFAITLIICLIPINAIYSITLTSDALFSYSLLFLCFLIKVMLDKNGHIDKKMAILMALTIGVMSGLNNYGIVIAIPTLIAITYYLLKKGNSENTLLNFAGLAILCIFLIASLNFVYDVHTDKLNIPTTGPLDDDINIKSAQNQFFSTINAEPAESYETPDSPNYGTDKYNQIDSFVDFWRGNFLLDILFDNAIISMFLSVVLLGLIYVRTESDEIFMVYVPIFLNVIISIFTGQSMYPAILVFYLVVIICASLFFRVNLKSDDFRNIPPRISRPGRIERQPVVQAEENYADDEYYSHLESEIENLTLDDIHEMLGETPHEETPKPQQSAPQKAAPQQPAPQKTAPQEEVDLLDEILKEIELGNKK